MQLNVVAAMVVGSVGRRAVSWRRVVGVIVVRSRGVVGVIRLSCLRRVLVVGRRAVTDRPSSAVVGVGAASTASFGGQAREEEEQDEEDSNYAGEKHPASPSVPSAVAVVAVASVVITIVLTSFENRHVCGWKKLMCM